MINYVSLKIDKNVKAILFCPWDDTEDLSYNDELTNITTYTEFIKEKEDLCDIVFEDRKHSKNDTIYKCKYVHTNRTHIFCTQQFARCTFPSRFFHLPNTKYHFIDYARTGKRKSTAIAGGLPTSKYLPRKVSAKCITDSLDEEEDLWLRNYMADYMKNNTIYTETNSIIFRNLADSSCMQISKVNFIHRNDLVDDYYTTMQQRASEQSAAEKAASQQQSSENMITFYTNLIRKYQMSNDSGTSSSQIKTSTPQQQQQQTQLPQSPRQQHFHQQQARTLKLKQRIQSAVNNSHPYQQQQQQQQQAPVLQKPSLENYRHNLYESVNFAKKTQKTTSNVKSSQTRSTETTATASHTHVHTQQNNKDTNKPSSSSSSTTVTLTKTSGNLKFIDCSSANLLNTAQAKVSKSDLKLNRKQFDTMKANVLRTGSMVDESKSAPFARFPRNSPVKKHQYLLQQHQRQQVQVQVQLQQQQKLQQQKSTITSSQTQLNLTDKTINIGTTEDTSIKRNDSELSMLNSLNSSSEDSIDLDIDEQPDYEFNDQPLTDQQGQLLQGDEQQPSPSQAQSSSSKMQFLQTNYMHSSFFFRKSTAYHSLLYQRSAKQQRYRSIPRQPRIKASY